MENVEIINQSKVRDVLSFNCSLKMEFTLMLFEIDLIDLEIHLFGILWQQISIFWQPLLA